MTNKLTVAICFLSFCGLLACTDGPSKSEQEKIIREEYPQRIHLQNWENSISLTEFGSFYRKQPNHADGLMFYVIWGKAKNNGYLEATVEKVRKTDESIYAKSYTEYFNQYYSDYEDDGTPDLDLIQKDYLNIYGYSNVPSKEEIFEYMIGHMKACAYTPIIVGAEYIKDKNIGPYWILHFSEGNPVKLRFFKKDDGIWDFETF